MVGLLDLPLELREPILLDVVLDTIEQQPEQPFKSPRGYQSVSVAEDPWDEIEGTHAYYVDLSKEYGFCKSLKRHALSLLHINQQIRVEAIDLVLRKLNQRIDDVKLDVAFELGTSIEPINLWATWLSAPFPAEHVNTLHTQIRYFQVAGTINLPHLTPVSLAKDCCEWAELPPAEMLLRFVEQSLYPRAGNPASIHERQRTKRPARSQPLYSTIQKLIIDIPIDPNTRGSCDTPVRCMRCQQHPNSVPRREILCMVPSGKRAALVFAESLHESLLGIFHHFNEYLRRHEDHAFRRIFECVGIIDLNVDSRLFRSVNLGRILARTPCRERWPTDYYSRAGFFKWKRAAENERKAAGFEPVNPSSQEHHLAGSAGLICSVLAARDESLFGEAAEESSEENAQTDSQPATDERVAFEGKAVLVQEDGRRLSGDATFYCASHMTWRNQHHFGHSNFPPSVGFHGGERPREGELVLFEGETIAFAEDSHDTHTIVSGDAIFYGTSRRDQYGSAARS